MIGCGLFLLAGLGYATWRFGPDIANLYRAGFFSPQEKRAYDGDTVDNLRAIHTALMLYHDSEGQFPAAPGWMAAIEPRLRTADLEPAEAAKKLRRPGAASGYGYALNRAAAARFKDDVPGRESAVLVYESRRADRDHAGDPREDGFPGGKAVTVAGAIVRLP